MTNLYHNILFVFGLIISDIRMMSLISVDLWLWYIDQFYILFWIRLESGTAYCLSWRYLHWFDIEITSCVVDTEHCEVHSLQVMRTQLETLGEEFKLAGNIWWREPTVLWVWTLRCIGIVKTMAIFGHLICLRVLWWDVSVLWGQYLHHRHRDLWIIHLILWCAFYRSWDDFGLSSMDNDYYSGWEDFSVYNCGFGWPTVGWKMYNCIWRPTEHSILHWGWKLWDAISMWKADLEKELCVLTMFCIQKKIVQIPCVNHFVFEKLVSLWLMSWLFTFGWEPVWFENFWKCFDVLEFI